MKLNANNSAFGRHETFFCRIGWLTKGFWKANEFSKTNNQDFFRQDQAVVTLGAGKNMVSSIKYWLQAARLFRNTEQGLEPTKLGISLMGTESSEGWDAYLEDKNTLWLIHWLIASNSALATTFFWFFNLYHKPNFTQEELRTALFDFTKENIESNPSHVTLKNDISVLTRMYAKSSVDKKMAVEDSLDSPLVELDLIQLKDTKEYSSSSRNREIAPHIIAYAMCDIFNERERKSISVEQLIYSRDMMAAIGSVFRLSENRALALIESAIDLIPGNFEIRESAGTHQVFKHLPVNGMDYLEQYYSGGSK